MRAMEAVMSRSDCARDIDTAPPRRPRGASDPDAGLVERLRREEEGAAEALVAAYGNRVYRLAIRITGNSSDAEEVVQDALLAATRKIDTFLGTAAFGSWIYRITANAACQKRRKRRVERAEVAWDDLGPSFDELGQHVQPGVDWSPRLKDPALQAELRTHRPTHLDRDLVFRRRCHETRTRDSEPTSRELEWLRRRWRRVRGSS